MQSYAGNGYTLKIYENEVGLAGPGLFYVIDGSWNIGDKGFITGECGDILNGPVDIEGTGTLAVAHQWTATGTVKPGVAEYTTKPWGYEISVEGSNVRTQLLLKLIRVDEGCRTSLQSHKHKDEYIVALEGEGPTLYTKQGDDFVAVGKATAVNLKPGIVHRTEGPTLLVEASTYHPHDVIRHEDDYNR